MGRAHGHRASTSAADFPTGDVALVGGAPVAPLPIGALVLYHRRWPMAGSTSSLARVSCRHDGACIHCGGDSDTVEVAFVRFTGASEVPTSAQVAPGVDVAETTVRRGELVMVVLARRRARPSAQAA